MRHHRRVLCSLAISVLAAGCQSPSGEAPDDEVLAVARLGGKTPEQVARERFTPEKIEDVRDYFNGMDTLGLPEAGTKDHPDQLVDLKDESEPATATKTARPGRRVAVPELTKQEAFGRNTWMIWCSGNEGFWDWLAAKSYGGSDLLKVVDSRDRPTLFRDAGLINEPGMVAPGAPEETDFGLWLNVPADPTERNWRREYLRHAFTPGGGYPADAYDFESAYPPPGVYGLSSGVLGLRLFPNPNFDAAARLAWDPDRFYNDPDYYSDPDLVRPFRVGMSCAFCHVSFHPLQPPADLANPTWKNISGNTGAQYLRIRSTFANLSGPDNFVYHLLDSQPPGTIDTSLLPSDNINNTNTMNSIFGVPERVALSFKNPEEQLSATSATQPSVYTDREFAEGRVPAELLQAIPGLARSNSNPRRVPRILLDGSDSVGAYTALSRVYLNIGSYWEQWLRIHDPIIGFRPQVPFRIDDCEAHSVYWNATQHRVGPMRDYFLRITPPMRLLDVQGDIDRTQPVDEARLRERATREGIPFGPLLAQERAKRIDTTKLADGRRVFAHNCIVCHSSRQPPGRHAEMEKFAQQGEFWDHDPGRWLSDPDYIAWAEKEVKEPDFWVGNFLSTDYRIPVNYVGTNSARAVATNAMSGHMWNDFSSADYQALPPIGSIPFFNPYRPESGPVGDDLPRNNDRYTPRHIAPKGVAPGGGGPGFYRVPTLISIWAAAPLLHNNSLGLFNNDPSVDGRLIAFDDAIRKLLWPARRLEGSGYNGATPERLRADHGLIWRTPTVTKLRIPARQVPYQLRTRIPWLMRWLDRLPWLGDRRWYLLPAGLIFLAFVVLWRWSGRRYIRLAAGYLPLVAGLLITLAMALFSGGFGDLEIGPIPAGTPVDLLASINPEADPETLTRALTTTISALAEIESRHLEGEDAQRVFREKVAPALMEVSRCPDFVMDRGHYFPWFDRMTDADKDALIELLKTF